MLQEHDLIPFEACALPPGPWLVFAPHPDDETFGMGGSIALAASRGVKVDVVVVTGGEGAGDVHIRQDECLAAGNVLGVTRHHFWSLPDRGVGQAASVASEVIHLLDSLDPQTVFLPGIQEYHPDHRATTRLIWDGLRAARYAGSVWLYEITRQSEANRLIDITPVHKVKQKAISCFASQLEQVNYADVVWALNKVRTYTLGWEVEYAEGFWAVSEPEHGVQDLQDRVAVYAEQTKDFWLHNVQEKVLGLVSVIVRSVNRPELQEALASIAAQSYAHIEVLLVDAAGENILCTPRCGSFPVRIISRGRPLSRPLAANAGLEVVQGEFFCFLDEDDLLDPEHIEHLVTALHSTEDLAVYSGVRCIRGDTTKTDIVLNEAFDRLRLMWNNFIPNNALLFRKKLLDAGCFFDPSLDCYEDWDFLLQAVQHTDFQSTARVTAYYRAGGSSGVGLQGAHPDRVGLMREKVLNKWRHRFSDAGYVAFLARLAGEDRKAELEQLRDMVHKARDREEQLIAEYERSISWKVTAPLRCVSRSLKKVMPAVHDFFRSKA